MTELEEISDGTAYHESIEAIISLANIIENFHNNEDEIYKILVQVSTLSGNFLPYKYINKHVKELHQRESFLVSLHQLITSIADVYCKKVHSIFFAYLKHLNDFENKTGNVQINHLDKNSINKVCFCIEKLSVLCGNEYATKTISNTASKCMDNLLQHHMKYYPNAFQEIKDFESNISALLQDMSILTLDIIQVLCLVDICSKNIILEIVTEQILNKLQNVLLVLINSTLENVMSKNEEFESQNKSSVSINSTQENPVAFLLLNELESLCNIIKEILNLEKKLNVYQVLKITSGETDEDTKTRQKSVLKHNHELPDVVASSRKYKVPKSTASFGIWNWQELFKELGPVFCTSIVHTFEDNSVEYLKETRSEYYSENKFEVMMEKSEAVKLRSDSEWHPKVCISCFAKVLKIGKIILPLAVMGMQFKPMSQVYSKYLECFSNALKSMKSFLVNLMSDVPGKCSIEHLYLVLSTCEDVCLTLKYCGHCLYSDEDRFLFQGISQVYCDLMAKVTGIINHYLTSDLVNYVLHDPVSHDWKDHRDFSEGDSCSHAIRAWNLQLEKIWVKLSSSVSEKACRNIFSHVFTKSLECLNNRYARCLPSYNRTKQVKRDILSILLITHNHFWRIEKNPQKIFPFDLNSTLCLEFTYNENNKTNTNMSQVHSLCQNFLTSLTVLTSPIANLSNGLNNSDADESIKISNWLHEISKKMFPKTWNGSIFSLTNEAAIYTVLKLLPIHHSSQLTNTLFALLIKDSYMPELIFTNSPKILYKDGQTNDDVKQHIYQIFSCSLFSMVNDVVFSKCVAIAIGKNFKSLVYQTFTDNKTFIWKWEEFVQGCICNLMPGSLQRTVEYAVNYTWSHMGTEVISLLPLNLQQHILKISSGNAFAKEDNENSTLLCLILLLQGLHGILRALPIWLVNVFYVINKKLKKLAKTLIFESYGLHVLVTFMEQWLTDIDSLENQLGLSIRKEASVFLKDLSGAFRNLCENDEVPLGDENLVRILNQTMEELKDVGLEVFNMQETESSFEIQLYQDCKEFVSSLYQNNTEENEEVLKSLSYVRDVLLQNINNWKTVNSFSTILPQATLQDQQKKFNPIVAMNHIGDHAFDQENISNHEFDWDRLVTSQVVNTHSDAIMSIVKRRWDMQPDAFLQEDEISPVKNVKKILNL